MTPAQIARDALAIRHYGHFVRQAAEVIGARKFRWNWHNQVVCDELEAVARGEVRELLICIPPGLGKSLMVSALFQAWDWLHNPTHRTVVLSANDKPVKRDAITLRNLIRSPWYRRLDAVMCARARKAGIIRRPITLADDQNESTNFVINDPFKSSPVAGGQRVCSTMTSTIIGERYEGMIVDDPVSPLIMLGSPDQVRAKLEDGISIYDGLESRLDPEVGWRITIMQPVGPGDISRELVKRGVRHVHLPMEGDPDSPTRHVKDMRAEGELLYPERFGRAAMDAIKNSPRPDVRRIWRAQYMLRPEPLGGSLFKREWFTRPDRTYSTEPQRLARTLDDVTISIDCTFGKGKGRDRVSMFVAGRKDGRKYALDLVVAQMDFPEMIEKVADLRAKWPMARVILIELAAAGDPMIATLQRRGVSGVIGFTPSKYGSKAKRAAIGSVPAFEAGDWWLPEAAPWKSDFVEEHVGFEEGCAHDDIVDSVSQLCIRWDSGEESFADRVKRMTGR